MPVFSAPRFREVKTFQDTARQDAGTAAEPSG